MNDQVVPIEEVLSFLIRQVVEYPEDVVVVKSMDDMGVLLSVKVNQADFGRVVGKQGKNITAIRAVMRIIGMRNGSLVSVKVDDEKRRPTAPSYNDSQYMEI